MWLDVVYVPLLLSVTQSDTTEQFVIVLKSKTVLHYNVRNTHTTTKTDQPNPTEFNTVKCHHTDEEYPYHAPIFFPSLRHICMLYTE